MKSRNRGQVVDLTLCQAHRLSQRGARRKGDVDDVLADTAEECWAHTRRQSRYPAPAVSYPEGLPK